MALLPLFGRSSSSLLADPFFWDPLAAWKVAVADSDQPSFSAFAKDLQAVASTRIDWKETHDAHIISADLPGLTKEEVTVEVVEKSVLRISGERKKEEVKETDKWHRVERAAGRFLRSFRLPENADTDSISAKFDKGVLVVTVPKSGAPQSDVKPIDVSGDQKQTEAGGAPAGAVNGQ